jgi:hypothetical protein
MNYEKIDAYEKCMLFWKEHKDDIECMHYGRSRYVKVTNKDRAYVTTKVAVKQLHCIPITLGLKRLFVCEETTQQMSWHKEGIHDSEDPDIMLHHADAEAWHTLDRFDPEFTRDLGNVRLGLSTDGFQPYNSDSTAYSCWSVFMMPYNLPPNKCLKEGFIFLALVILCPKEPRKQMNIFFVSIDGRVVVRGRCI